MDEGKQRVALVIGASGGIGRCVAELMSDRGYKVIGLSRRGLFIDGHVHGNEGGIGDVSLDIDSDESILSSYKYIKSKVDCVDTLIISSGRAYGSLVGMMKRDDLRGCIETNLVSPVMVIQAFVRLLKKAKKPTVVNVSSISAYRDDLGTLGYASAKAGLNQATRILAREFGRYNIRVNAVAPGVTDTPMVQLMDEKSKNLQIEDSISKEYAQPIDVAELVFFLASDASHHINGQVIKIDGGQGC